MTTQTPIEVLTEAVELGLKLSFKPPFTLVVDPAKRCPGDFVDTLSQHKPDLLALLQLPFCMVWSEALQDTIYFCEDEATKTALVEAGADEWCIYTKDELRVLVAHNRTEPFTPSELRKLHEAKRQFNASVQTNENQYEKPNHKRRRKT
jgi:hypothetical protein